jgi:hypothetical protein
MPVWATSASAAGMSSVGLATVGPIEALLGLLCLIHAYTSLMLQMGSEEMQRLWTCISPDNNK